MRGRGRPRASVQTSSLALRSRGTGGRILRAGVNSRSAGLHRPSAPTSSQHLPTFSQPPTNLPTLDVYEPLEMQQDDEMDAGASSGDSDMDFDAAVPDHGAIMSMNIVGECR